MTAQLTRRTFLGSSAALAAAAYGMPAHAQANRFAGRQVVFATFTSTRDMFQQEIATWLKQTTGGDLSLLPLAESVAYARMQAELADPQIDMFVSISENEFDAKTKGISQKITYMDNAKKISPDRLDPDGFWVHWAIIGEGILYRTDKVKTPPTSYMDLFKPEYAGHVMFPTIVNAYGFDFLIMMAKLHGGSEKNIDPGFEALKKLRAAGAPVIRGTPPEIQQQFAQNDMWLLPYDTGNAHMAQQVGLPIAFATPQGGAPAVFCSVFVTKNSKNGDLASYVVDRLLGPEVQSKVATQLGYVPVLPGVDTKGVNLVLPRPDQIIPLDRATMRANRAAWTERFQKEIAS